MMDTMTTDKKRIRRNHSPALKAQVLAECEAPGASVAQVAMSHGINANIVHGWRESGSYDQPQRLRSFRWRSSRRRRPSAASTSSCAAVR